LKYGICVVVVEVENWKSGKRYSVVVVNVVYVVTEITVNVVVVCVIVVDSSESPPSPNQSRGLHQLHSSARPPTVSETLLRGRSCRSPL
jgi:hypothetical protein